VDPSTPPSTVPDPIVIKIYGAKRIEIPGFTVTQKKSQGTNGNGESTITVN